MRKSTLSSSLLAGAVTLLVCGPQTAAAAPPEDMAVWRAQIRLRTCDTAVAATDDPVRVRLNGDNFTWLDHPGDDFERNDLHVYDLKLDNVGTIADITWLRVGKTGSDGWCIRRIDLLINGAMIYRRIFKDGLLLDNDGAHATRVTADAAALRANPWWIDYEEPSLIDLSTLSFTIDRLQIEQRVESLVGDLIYGSAAYWGQQRGPRFVEASRQNDTDVHVDVDLAIAAPSPFADPRLDLDFDLRFACQDGVISITPRELELDVKGVLDAVIGEEGMAEDAAAALQPIAVDPGLGFCPVITIETDGSVTFSLG